MCIELAKTALQDGMENLNEPLANPVKIIDAN